MLCAAEGIKARLAEKKKGGVRIARLTVLVQVLV
jgi:hypothetical protein